MRIIVMFDLPNGNARERRTYAQFRKFLKHDGYRMEQFSVYTRPVMTRESARDHVARLKAHLPEAGMVTVLTVTEVQFASRLILVDTKEHKDDVIDIGDQMTLIL